MKKIYLTTLIGFMLLSNPLIAAEKQTPADQTGILSTQQNTVQKGEVKQSTQPDKQFQRPDFCGCGGPPPEFIKRLKAAGVTQDELRSAHEKGPEAVKQLMNSHGIQPPFGGRHMGPPPELMRKMKEAGITQKELEKAHNAGPEAMKKLLDARGVQPPVRPPFGPPPGCPGMTPQPPTQNIK